MNRTDRLYAVVEELRAVAPRPRSSRWLAGRFEVSPRTIERDVSALQQAGTPIYVKPGRSGGYVLDPRHTLPPLNITPQEAVAVAAGLQALAATPFAETARSALHKLLAVMPEREIAATHDLGGRIGFIKADVAPVPRGIQQALTVRRVLRISYADRNGEASERLVEPLAFLGGSHWYLLGWCRLREAVRGFRLDRVERVTVTDESVPRREIDLSEFDALGHDVIPITHLTLSGAGPKLGA
ncbi:helix-turn-helix transcriptional regulator [Nonomuraea sp. NPDC050536]|uniref:helix-turn-helix transcriptional regulator n=1 Tax=Nonomuraea sp. NPDC050536 TaxID=3364366 RepID=UPI0037CBABD2